MPRLLSGVLFASFVVAFAVASVGIILASRDLLSRLESLSIAATDNVQWVLSQIEVEYLVFGNTVQDATLIGEDMLDDVRMRFDIFYSRINTISSGTIYQMHADEEFNSALANVKEFLDMTLPLIDGDDATLLENLVGLDAEIDAMRPSVRKLGLRGISVFSAVSDERRNEISQTLTWVAVLAVTIFSLLLISCFVMLLLQMRLVRSKTTVELSRARMSAIVSSSLDAVIVADSDGHIVDYNNAGETLFGFSHAEVIGRKMSETIVPPHMREAHDAGLARYVKTKQPHVIGKGRVQLEAVHKDGSLFPVELSISSAETGEGEFFVSFLRDIKDRLDNEAELRDARDRALAGERAKAQFLAVMSHEMRTPLNGLLGTLELVDTEALSESNQNYLEVIRQSGEMLLHHVNDVLDISRIDAGQAFVKLENFYLSDVIEGVVKGLESVAKTGGNTLDFACAPDLQNPVYGDPRKLRQVLFNLVGNAVKFTKEGAIEVTAERVGHGAEVEIKVLDTGKGVREADIERIFDDFVTLDSSYVRQQGGTGLGLGITRRLVRLMGGEINVESALGEGSVFWITVPLPEAEPGSVVAAHPTEDEETLLPVTPDQELKVLVVEDNEINRMITHDLLTNAGHSVEEANDGVEGFDRATWTKYDVILMDISMPRMDGIEATTRIRSSDGPNSKTRIVALTAHALPNDIERFRDAGMDAVLTKPISRDRLLAVISATPSEGDAIPEAKPDIIESVVLRDLHETIGGDRLSGLVAAFVRQSDLSVAKIVSENSNEISDSELIAEIHKLAGAAGTFGAARLHALLSRLEEHGKSGNTAHVRENLQDIATVWAECRPSYADWQDQGY